MRWPIVSVLLVVTSAASLAVGALWQARRIDDKANEFPCVARFLNPSAAGIERSNVAADDCLILERSKEYRGVWVDAPVGADFISTDPSLPKDVQLWAPPFLRAEIYRKAGIEATPGAPTMQRYEITIVGRLGREPIDPQREIVIDSSENKMVVEEVLSARPI